MKTKPQNVKLRPIRLSDAPRYVKWLNDPAVTRFLSRSPGITLKQERDWITNTIKDKAKKVFALIYKSEHIGSISIDKIDQNNMKGSLGIFIGEKDLWNKGVGTIATQKMVRYGFNKLKLHKIYLCVFPKNKRAIKIYQKLGFAQEGYLKDDFKKNGRYSDLIQMAIIKK
ncbi:GNAT family N-acetyltransferase [Patescibacteria group bacterium]|nr:GNAT family N-acetyltransferase [Patescibacteria group bacterium]